MTRHRLLTNSAWELQGDLHSFAYAGLPPSPARYNKHMKELLSLSSLITILYLILDGHPFIHLHSAAQLLKSTFDPLYRYTWSIVILIICEKDKIRQDWLNFSCSSTSISLTSYSIKWSQSPLFNISSWASTSMRKRVRNTLD